MSSETKLPQIPGLPLQRMTPERQAALDGLEFPRVEPLLWDGDDS